MSDFVDKFIEDIIKGASESFARGKRVSGEQLNVQHGGGREEKLANHTGLNAGLASLVGGLGSPSISPYGAAIAAASSADEGRRLPAALAAGAGNAMGGSLGAGLGAALSGPLHINPDLAMRAGRVLGGTTGGALGGHLTGDADRGMLERAYDKLSAAADEGAKIAAERFGVKEAFLPLLGSIAGPALARAGMGALARGAGGNALGGMASKLMPRIGGGIGGMAFDAASSMAGGALGGKLQSPGPVG